MSKDVLRVGTIGGKIVFTVSDKGAVFDLSGASTHKAVFRKPSGARFEAACTLVDGGSAGKMQYVFVDGDLDESGTWQVQGWITDTDGTWPSDVVPFPVMESL